MRNTEIATKGSWRKPSKLVALIAAIVLIATVVCAVIFGSLIPAPNRIAVADGSRYTSTTGTGRDEYFYATANANIYRMSGEDEELEKFDLKAELAADTSGKFKDLEITDIRTIYMEEGSKYLWVGTSAKEIIQLVDENGKLSLVDCVTLDGDVATMVEHGDTLYVINRYLSFYQLGSYNVNSLSDGKMAQGYLYDVSAGNIDQVDKSQERKLEAAELKLLKNCSMLSVEVIEEEGGEYLYIFYTDGLIRISTDFSMNAWRDEFSPVIPARTAELIADEGFRAEMRAFLLNPKKGYGYTEGEPQNTKEKKLTDELFEKELATLARRSACEEYSKDADVTLYDYDDATGQIFIKRSDFDRNKYNCYLPDPELGIAYCGAGYDSERDTYYIVANNGAVYSYERSKVEELDSFSPTLEADELEGIKLAGTPNVSSTFYYSDVTKKGYVTYANSNLVSLVNFNTMSVDFTSAMSFNMRGITQNPTGDRIFYVYYNSNEGETGHLLFATVAIGEQLNEGLWRALRTVSVILAIMSGVTLLFALLCAFKKGFTPKFQDVMHGFVKQWGIYSCILVSMVLLVTFCYYPAIGSIRLSFFDYTRDKPAEMWNNFAHYKQVFSAGALKMFGNMIFFLFFDLLIALGPPLIFAFFLTIMRNRNVSGVIRTLLFIPGIIPGVATTMIWKMGIYGSFGVLNSIITLFGGKTVTFLGATSLSRWSLVLMGFPFVGSYLIFYGAMMNVPDSYYEAAELDGITVRKRFIFIDIPLIFPQIKYVIIMTFIGSAQNFGRTYMIFGNAVDAAGLKTPIHELYVQIQMHGNYGLASAYATILFLLLFAATVVNMRMKQKDNEV